VLLLFDKVTQIAVGVLGLFCVVVDGQPREPSGQNLIDVYSRAVVFEDFGDGANGVLSGLHVLGRATFAIVYHLYEKRQTAGARLSVLYAAAHGHHAHAVAGRLSHLGGGIDQLLEHALQERVLILDRLDAAKFQHVVPHTQRPLAVAECSVRFLQIEIEINK
jgi:hypothetical protein